MMMMGDKSTNLLKTSKLSPAFNTPLPPVAAGAAGDLGSEDDDQTSELISNLDHDIPEIRVRALKHLHRKLDLGLVYGTRLSKRVDLLQRLTSWLRSNKWTEDELVLIVQFLSDMCQREEFRKNFMNTPLDSLLGKARRLVRGDTRSQIDRLMDTVQSFDIYCEGPAEDWHDNSSIPLKSQSTSARLLPRSCSAVLSPRSKLSTPSPSSTSIKMLKPPPETANTLMESRSNSDQSKGDTEVPPPDTQTQPEGPEPATDVYYFASSSKPKDDAWIKTVQFGIPTIRLETSDRRVMSSTVESFLSKNENLIMITTCFLRDVLLNDFPPETFVQESSLCMGLLQVLEEPWEDSGIHYASFQALLKLSYSLQTRLGYLDSSEFYQHSQQKPSNTSPRSSYRSNSYSAVILSPLAESTENLLNSLIQLLKGISRALTFKPKNIFLWILMDSFSATLQRYVEIFNGNSKTMYISLEEVMLDLSQCMLRFPEDVNPCHVALIFSSLLACFRETDSLMLTKDVRRVMWSLASSSKLSRDSSSFILRHFLQRALPVEPGLDKAKDQMPNEFSMDNYHSSWWKTDVVSGYRPRDISIDETKDSPDPDVMIPTILVSIQNAIEHRQVVEGIESLWSHLLALVLNLRSDEEGIDNLIIPPNAQWREAFYRFLSVEPTSVEDEDLLVRVLDLMAFLLKYLKDSKSLKKWVVPLVSEKGSAILRVLLQYCNGSGTTGNTSSAPNGTNLPTIIRSIFDFYYAMLLEGSSSAELGGLLNTLIQILKTVKNEGFNSPAILHAVIHLLAHLTSEASIISKLQEDSDQTVLLLEYAASSIQALGERTNDGSYRNRGALQYATLLLLHLSMLSSSRTAASFDWVGYTIPVLPFLWIIENSVVRAAALQISSIITSTAKGTLMLLSELESPTLLWSYAYTRLNDQEETPVVRQKAGTVILNLINHWDEMRMVAGSDLEVPCLQLLEDSLKLLQQVYWHSKLSTELGSTENQENRYGLEGSGDAPNSLTLITPKVLSAVSSMISAIVAVDKSNIQPTDLILREITLVLSRTLGKHKVTREMDETWWIECCGALGNTVNALISIVHLDRSLSLILISDRLDLAVTIQMLGLVSPQGKLQEKSSETLTTLWKNIFILLSTLCSDAGYNFEDLERGIWTQRNVIFPRLIEWLNTGVPGKQRRVALDFLNTYLSKSHERHSEDKRQLFLCQQWKDSGITYGVSISQNFNILLDEALGIEEKICLLQCMNNLYRLSPTAKNYALENHVIKKLLRALRDFGVKSIDSNMIQPTRKNLKDQEHVKCILIVLTTLFHKSSEAKELGLAKHCADVIHSIFKFANNLHDRVLLHGILECIINFTDEFPKGSQSLTLTSGLNGVPSRKIATPNSLYMEFLGLLQTELDSIEKTPNLKTTEMLMALLGNTIFSPECRNVFLKVKILNFIRRLHATEMKKWGHKYPQVKHSFLQFLHQLTFYPDMQTHVAKVQESVEIFILLAENEPTPISLIALQIIRNISFHNGNRPRLLHDVRFMSGLAERLKSSDNLEELQCVGVTLWALTTNCEKGKLTAKRMGCVQGLNSAIQRLRRKEASKTSRVETNQKCNLPTVLKLLEKVCSIQSTSTTGLGGIDELDTYRDS